MRLKELKYPHKGILTLLALFGNPVAVVEECEKSLL